MHKLLIPAATGLGTAGVLFVVRGIAMRLLRKWADRTETMLDDMIIAAIKTPSVFWCITVGMGVGISVSDLHAKYVQSVSVAIHVLIIFSITIAAANLAGQLLTHYIRQTDLPFKNTGLVYGILNGLIYVLGILIILSVLGISIAPLITALGVGGLAVALALQDTLANLFSGLHILLEKSIRVNDFVKLENGQEGTIIDITWRTTRIRLQPNIVVVIPNSKLAQSVVINYSLPEDRTAIAVQVGVDYSSDLDHVESVLLDEVQKATAEVAGMLTEPQPLVRLDPGFGESSLDFTVICSIRDYAERPQMQHELRKRIFKRFKKENIVIPFPHRTIVMQHAEKERTEA
ncbi:MAG: mechanosensitive ion channel family protein [Nitrospirota bacterium]|nr:mechanosensitive ion channel family protein [Nitrospirota bacterium]